MASESAAELLRKAQVVGILELVCQALELTASQYDVAKSRYESVGSWLAESANALRRAGLIATSRVIDADPREAILAAAETSNANTIYVGARGLGRMDRLLLGSVSTAVVTRAHCSVEVVRAIEAV